MRVVQMKKEEFFTEVLEKGEFMYLGKEGNAEVYGRVTYEDGFTSDGNKGQDWELWYVYPDRAVHRYETNRCVPGWTMCEWCGNWMTYDEYEEHKEYCVPEVVHFRR